MKILSIAYSDKANLVRFLVSDDSENPSIFFDKCMSIANLQIELDDIDNPTSIFIIVNNKVELIIGSDFLNSEPFTTILNVYQAICGKFSMQSPNGI